VTRAALALALAACTTPTPQIKLKLSRASDQMCPADCAQIPLPCDAMMSIRVIDRDDPTVHHLDQCVSVAPNTKNDVCSLNRINLDSVAIPVRDLAVQIAVFPRAALAVDESGAPVCPNVEYNMSNGLPITQAGAPVLGGQTYYHPGDSIVEVTLGCTDLSAMTAGESCKSPPTSLTATVDDFDTRVPVRAGPQGADRLYVSVGEPRLLDGGYVLNPRDTTALRLDDDPTPQWTASGEPGFNQHACVEVLDDKPSAIASLHCTPVSDPEPLKGFWIKNERLHAILASLGLEGFPAEGLTVGMVVDATANGVPNYTVKAGGANVVYVTDSGVAGGSVTSNTGIFVSRDAPFGTMFNAIGQKPTVPAVGGLVVGKVTVVIVPFAAPQ
jgi:hypothetical protein